MHPVQYLFEEIYRDYWGIPRSRDSRERVRRNTPVWLRERQRAEERR
jgi:hypothetical protein